MRFVDRIRGHIGEEFFVSDWLEITQADVDTFADVTKDWDYMHNDPTWAREQGPWARPLPTAFISCRCLPIFTGRPAFPRWRRKTSRSSITASTKCVLRSRFASGIGCACAFASSALSPRSRAASWSASTPSWRRNGVAAVRT